MQYTICSRTREATISATGAELRSLVDRVTGEEFLWQGDPTIWSGRAPILFPIVGGLKNGRYEHEGIIYEMAQHGFARKSVFYCVEATEDRLILSLRSSPDTLKQYPWNFSLQVEFYWRDEQLVVSYQVTNNDDSEMLFNIGSHPAFRLPLDNAALEDYSIEFSDTETLDTWSIVDALLETTPTRFMTQQRVFDLSPTLFDKDALVFMNIESSTVALSHRQTGVRVRVETDRAPHLGIWAKPAAPYVCIEPWWGYADFVTADGVLGNKSDVQRLAAGDGFSTHIAIETIASRVG